MRNVLFIFLLIITPLNTIAQGGNEVEKSVIGIQTGFLGIWAHNEARLSKSLALRTELGFDSGLWGGSLYENTGFLMTPVITAEPRFYYNLEKRNEKSKRTDGNSGNFLSVKISYHPDWFVISNYEDLEIISDISLIPTWGIRRNLGRNFNYEAGFGVGYQYFFYKSSGFSENEGDVAINLHLRIGYRF